MREAAKTEEAVTAFPHENELRKLRKLRKMGKEQST